MTALCSPTKIVLRLTGGLNLVNVEKIDPEYQGLEGLLPTGLVTMATLSGTNIPKAYNPKEVEQRIYRFWMEGGYFTPKIDPSKKPFVIIMPPPNVTGKLHLGHALTAAVEDMLTRWHRMRGDATLWLPSKDHAGIATQWVVEQQLANEGTSRQELGRDRFVERVWEWVKLYGNTIDEQHKSLGASCDWSRLRFTLDPGPSKAVRTTFANLYQKGLIYRGERIINWCPRCSTALSDLEVEHEETEGRLYYIRYPLAEGDGHITVATTRPETIMGDTAVAAHPEDPRYNHLLGRLATLPIIGRQVPIIADELIERDFGTGALKVTPGHDPVDFDIGQRHSLPIVTVIGMDGLMTEESGPYKGQERFQARKGIVAQLETEALLERSEPYSHSVRHCQRCKAVVEPLVSLQWFMKVGHHDEPDSIAGRAYAAVKDSQLRIIPDRFVKVYLNWLENIRDWCISRQLWWGHRIPVWYCDSCQGLTVEADDPIQCSHCGSKAIRQDPDVLDTWFSSALWTHSTLGWPNDTEDLRYFYPTSVMETGYDILFFWVARMIMMGIENMGQPPFHTVFLHGLIRDTQGVKMSKTKGNVLDPLQIIDQFGTDALRFALTTGTSPGNDLRIGESKLEASRNFANKLWNSARFVMMSLGEDGASQGWYSLPTLTHRQDRWIISRLNQVISQVNDNLEAYELGEAQRTVYEFLWGEFCDWYIEIAKIRLRKGEEPSPLPVLAHVLERTLRLLHPFMPFITEELWQRLVGLLPKEGEPSQSIMIAPYPEPDNARVHQQADQEMHQIILMIRAIRNTRAQLRVESGRYIEAKVQPGDFRSLLEEEEEVVRNLARVEPLVFMDGPFRSSEDSSVTLVVGDMLVQLSLAQVVDISVEKGRLKQELEDCFTNLNRLQKLLENAEFRAKAPDEIVEREEERLNSLQERQHRLKEILSQMDG